MKELTAEYWIDKLNLTKHPEGGYFREIYRSEEMIKTNNLPAKYVGDRGFSTSIYFLLKGKQKSKFHRLKSDEIWHFYFGSSLMIYTINEFGLLEKYKLGNNFDEGECFQVVIKNGLWFATELINNNSFALIGCTVAPAFDFSDFELARKSDLIKKFSEHKNLIESFC